jgi:hypothetical protein
MRYRKPTLKHLCMLTCFLLIGFVMSGTLAPTAEAAAGGCRSDPLVVLSDGTILDVSAEIGTAVSNVTEIHYVVHGPREVRLVAAVSTPTLGFDGKETFTYYADGAPNQYVTETLVQTSYDQVSVTAHTTFAKVTPQSGPRQSLQYAPIKGFNNQILRMLLER